MKTHAAPGRPDLTSQTVGPHTNLNITLDYRPVAAPTPKPQPRQPPLPPVDPKAFPPRSFPLDTVMGLKYNVYLDSSKIFGCKNCKTHLANHDDVISRNFRGQHGRAYLFSAVVNTKSAEPMERNMTTGRHVVRDIMCKQCGETVGWKYDKAYEPSEQYKEGKFILEAELLQVVY